MTVAERATRRSSALVHVLLAALVTVPTVLSGPGRVGADTKSYLTIDPGRLLSRAPWMWDPNVGMGTLTHQTIGYLFPMGPYYWLMERLGVPAWVTQRLWLSVVLFAAGAGVLFLARTIGWSGPGPVVAALAFTLSPYVLDYSARISVILLPWAALPWMIALAARALRAGGWRHPALFALVVLTVGGVNATALVFAGLGPVLWFPFAVWGTREATLGQALRTIGRIGVLTVITSLWWVIGLAVQGRYGIPILRYTETVEAVARTSLSSEVMRGLGYWFFYGNDKLGPWIEPAAQYTQHIWLIAVGYLLPALALVTAAVVRWRHRAYFVALLVTGVVIAVGPHPYDRPSPLGALFKAFATGSTAGLALRSTARAVPLVSLALAVFLGLGVSAVADRWKGRWPAIGAPLVAGVLVAAGLPALFTGQVAIARNLERPEKLPSYWFDAARYLDHHRAGTRVLELPGSDFAAYRWGNTVDPITPYLIERPYVARELIPYGTAASADLLNALDRRLQEGVLDPEAIAPIARLMGVGDVVLRNDLEFERYRTPRPRPTWAAFTSPRPPGLLAPARFGPATPNRPTPRLPLLDEIELGSPAGEPDPPAVASFPVGDPTPIVRTEPVAAPVVLAGDGEGVVSIAAAGLLGAGRGPIEYSASLDADALHGALAAGADLVLTDSNRQRARRWGTVRENTGYTEAPGSGPLAVDPADARLDVFPAPPSGAFTEAEERGIRDVRATHYGNPVSYTAEDRPANALDGDPRTAWRVGAFADVTGERLRVDLEHPVATDHITLVQPLTGARNRWMTRVRLHFDRGDPVTVALDDGSRTPAGQRIDIGRRTFGRIELEVLDTNVGHRAKYQGVSGVGVAELVVGPVRDDEVIRLPADLLGRAGRLAAGHRLTVVLERLRANAAEPVRSDEELALRRSFDLPQARTFSIGGTARLAADGSDDRIDALVGSGGVRARSDARLPGDLRVRAAAAFDGDPSTAWVAPFESQAGHWIEVDAGHPVDVGHFDLTVVADGRHSVPTSVSVSVDGGPAAGVSVPPIDDRGPVGRTVTVGLDVPRRRGQRIRITIDAVRPVDTTDYYSEAPIEMPVAVAEVGLAGLHPSAAPTGLDNSCHTDLATVDGRPIGVRVVGSAGDALDRKGLRIEGCGPTASLAVSPGRHELRAVAGRQTGIDLDRLVLDSAASVPPSPSAAPLPAPPRVTVAGQTRGSYHLRVAPSSHPSWLVLGESLDAGWHATAGGRSLGPSRLVDGYANGWVLPPHQGELDVHLDWTPQRTVWVALALSALGTVLCLGIVAVTSRRRRPPFRVGPSGSNRPSLDRAVETGGRVVWPVIGAGTFGLLTAGPFVGMAAAAITLAAVLVRRLRLLVALVPAALVALSGAYIALQQFRYRYPPDFAWPHNFERTNTIVWLAIALLLGCNLRQSRQTQDDWTNRPEDGIHG